MAIEHEAGHVVLLKAIVAVQAPGSDRRGHAEFEEAMNELGLQLSARRHDIIPDVSRVIIGQMLVALLNRLEPLMAELPRFLVEFMGSQYPVALEFWVNTTLGWDRVEGCTCVSEPHVHYVHQDRWQVYKDLEARDRTAELYRLADAQTVRPRRHLVH